MMDIMIWVDMEGICGIEAWEQVTGGSPMYEEGRRLMTEEVNAAVRGCRTAGADCVVVVDCHGAGGGWSFKSLLPELLEPGAEYVLGSAYTRYLEPLEQGCEAAVFVGFHAMAGTPDGVLSHTVSSEVWHNAWINDTLVGETGLAAAVCGHFGTPVAVLTGDAATCREATELLGPKLTTVCVKQGLGRTAARCLAPKVAWERIEQGVRDALQRRDWPPPYRPAEPTTFTVEVVTSDRANAYRGRQGVELVEPRKVVSRGPNFLASWSQFWHH